MVVLEVPRDHELRITVPAADHGAHLRLVGDGIRRAEVDGAALMPGCRYALAPGRTVWVMAWTSVTVEVEGSAALVAGCVVHGDSTHPRPLAEYHSLVHEVRRAAKESGEPSPRVLICGRASSGKHTAFQTLGNYAARQGACPTLVDLSPSSQCIGLPASVAACVLDAPLTPEDMYYDGVPSVAFMTGSTSPVTATDAVRPPYRHFALHLLGIVDARMAAMEASGGPASHSGSVIVAPSILSHDGGAALLHEMIDTVGATHVLCIGDGALYAALQTLLPPVAGLLPAGCGAGRRNARGGAVRLDFLCPSPTALPSEAALVRRMCGLRCQIHFQGTPLAEITPVRHHRAHATVTVFQLLSTDGRLAPTPMKLLDLKGLARAVCAVADLSDLRTGPSAASVSTAPVLCFAQLKEVSAIGIDFLATAHVDAIAAMEHVALIVSDFTWGN